MQPTPATWYLGPSYDMRALQTPDVGMSLPYERYGGTFQALSGARSMDVTGHRSAYELSWEYLDKADWDFLQAMNMRHLPGPHYLINPLSKNRLSPQASMCYWRGKTDGVGVWADRAVPQWQNGVFPTGVMGFRSLRASVWTFTTNNEFMFDRGPRTPVLNSEQITASIYVKADVSAPMHMSLRRFDKFGVEITPAPAWIAFTATTSWQRFSMTETEPSNVCSVQFQVSADNDDTAINLAAAQVESGATATAWEIGGGSARVLIDQLDTVSPRYPIQQASLTLLEA